VRLDSSIQLAAETQTGLAKPVVFSASKVFANPQQVAGLSRQSIGHGGTRARMFGSALADTFRTSDFDFGILGSPEAPEFAVTRVRLGPTKMERAREYAADQAILVWVSLTPASNGQWHAVCDGKSVGVTRAIPFSTTFVDLRHQMEMWLRGPFDYLHFYLSTRLLERIALDCGLAPGFQMREAFFVEDLVVAQLSKNVLASCRNGESLSGLALEEIATVLGAHILQRRSGPSRLPAARRCGLETWQKIRTEEMLHTQLFASLTTADLASACSLSESHFARCFRASYGISVHRHLIQLRIEHAKRLLSDTRKSLVDVALHLGFCDQAAFTRAFSRIERLTPARWRRFNRISEGHI
jgi:AraC family transcriptional regulator